MRPRTEEERWVSALLLAFFAAGLVVGAAYFLDRGIGARSSPASSGERREETP